MDWDSQRANYIPHGMCLLWRHDLMALHVVSDGLIALSCFMIPVGILRVVRGRDDLDRKHRSLAMLFAAFVALCGTTRLVGIIVLWIPVYLIEGWLKAITAGVSVATAFWVIALIPQALKLAAIKTMHHEIATNRATMRALDTARAALAERVGQTERELRSAQQHRHQSLALLSTVIETMPGLIYAKDSSGRMLLANQATLDLIGKQWSEVEGKRDDEYLGDLRQAEVLMANDRRVMDSGKAQEIEQIIDHPMKGMRVYLSSKVPFVSTDDAGGGVAGMVGVSIDITDRKQLNKDSLDMSRRLAMGEMATAIAHEINQPLAAIALFLDGSMTVLANDNYAGPLTRSLALAKEQCLRAGEIIRRVRSFVSNGEDSKQLEDIAHLVDEACALALIGSRESGVAVAISHAALTIPAQVDRVQIEQVIVNLVRNALDAVGKVPGAALWITTGYGADDMVVVSVRDNGPGIGAAVSDALFEPFVSTKGVQGMGVGLSICRTIIERHGGKIWVEPREGKGATFGFSLPPGERMAAG